MDTKNLGFATLMVETLSYILLTSKELFSLRTALRNLENEESGDLFVKLFGCWCHSPVPTLTLCLLSHCYEQAATLVHIISNLDTSADTLLELDKLIQMIESPIFSDLRLRLLCPSENRALIEALYGILMLIPQTSSFDLLRSRLACVPPVHLEGPPRQSKQNRESTKIDFNELLIHFKTTQEKHQQFRREVLKERLKSNFQKSVKI
ncbi:Protein VAC14-like protein [Armadillidium nasatum]|uniref:Protein VAC14-like protein n=1 Tax=Armadillidium nasatum TaxID=96803 RepID=A0A5N5TG91_9CRUS|nr:Protein VAC14-like protein [Armadillidium nasatum]